MPLTTDIDEQSYRARSDRRFLQGNVIDYDTVGGVAIVDVGAIDSQGNSIFLHNVPFQGAAPPNKGDSVSLLYGNVSPQSGLIAGSSVGGGNGGQPPQLLLPWAVAAPPDVAAAGSIGTLSQVARADHTHAGVHTIAGLLGDILVAAGANVTVTVAGSTITIAASGGSGAHALLDGSVDSDTHAAAVHAGDLVYGNATPLWDRLPVGSNGQVLQVSGGAPAWGAAPSHALLDGAVDSDTEAAAPVEGDVVYADSSSKWNRLGIGSTGEVLTVSGGVPAWAVAGGGSGGLFNVTVLSSAGGTYSASTSDCFIFAYTQTNHWTIILPPPGAPLKGKVIVIFSAYQGTTNGITVFSGSSGVTPVGISAPETSDANRACVWYVCDGVDWHSFTNSGGN